MEYHDYIWDLGGTLLDNYEISTKAFLETLHYFGKDASHEEVYQKLKESTEIAVSYFIPNQPEFLKYYKEKESKKLEDPILFDGAAELLKKIVESESRNFLVSHRNKQVLKILEKTQIDNYFSEIITSENHFARKPDPESMIYLKEKYHIANALVIGDRDIDLKAGLKAGFATLLVDGRKNLLEVVK